MSDVALFATVCLSFKNCADTRATMREFAEPFGLPCTARICTGMYNTMGMLYWKDVKQEEALRIAEEAFMNQHIDSIECLPVRVWNCAFDGPDQREDIEKPHDGVDIVRIFPYLVEPTKWFKMG